MDELKPPTSNTFGSVWGLRRAANVKEYHVAEGLAVSPASWKHEYLSVCEELLKSDKVF